MIDISLGTAGLTAILGYLVVFLGIVFLMIVISLLGTAMKNKTAKPAVNTSSPVQNSVPVNVGQMHAPEGVDPLQVAIMAAIAADMERGY